MTAKAHPLDNTNAADRAIVILAIRRLERLPGQTGIGANRDDHPEFTKYADGLMSTKYMDKEFAYQMRFRVKKYGRQVTATMYWQDKKTLEELIARYREVRSGIKPAEMEILLREAAGYGEW